MTNQRVLEIPSNETLVYRQILEFLLVGSKFTPQEKDVLAEYIKLNNDYEALPQDKRNKFIFSAEIRKEVAEKLGIDNENQVSTVLSTIKKKDYAGMKVLDSDNNINSHLLIKPNLDAGDYKIIINFKKSNINYNEQSKKNGSQVKENNNKSNTIEIPTEQSSEDE